MHYHNCSCPGCVKQIPVSKLMCLSHWHQVNPETRQRINAAWRDMQSNRPGSRQRYLDVRNQAISEVSAEYLEKREI